MMLFQSGKVNTLQRNTLYEIRIKKHPTSLPEHFAPEKVSEHSQIIPQSHTEDQPTAR